MMENMAKMLKFFEKFLTRSKSVKQGLKVANNVKKYQTMSKSIEQCQKVFVVVYVG